MRATAVRVRIKAPSKEINKTVLNLLEAVYLRLMKIVVERVIVVKFRVDNRGTMVLAVLESR